MLQLMFLFCSFQISSTVKSGSHSLWALSTFIIGDTQFPEFSVVLMLDDIQIAFYDSNVENLIYRQFKSEHEDEEKKDASFIFGNIHKFMKNRLYTYQLNHTHGVHTLQRLAGCELLDDDTPGPVREFNALNDPICIKILKNLLHMKKNDVMKKVKPRVRLLQKTLTDSGGAKVTCLATGFYPRHINLTLLRDGQPVSDHHITGGELLPNLDGTYQMRKSLEVSSEELMEKHLYSCTAKHFSLANKLDIKLDLDPGVGTVFVVIPVVVLGVALLCVVGAVVFIRRRSSTPSDYVLTQSSGDSNLQMNQNQNLKL